MPDNQHETLAQMWDGFARQVMPAGAPAVQRQEMRRAFYAGCWVMLMAMRNDLGSEQVSEEEGVAVLEGWMEECRRFQRDMLEGRA